MPFDLNPVEFLRLMEMAQRREWMRGNDITQAGRPYEDMFLIVEGTAEVRASPCNKVGSRLSLSRSLPLFSMPPEAHVNLVACAGHARTGVCPQATPIRPASVRQEFAF